MGDVATELRYVVTTDRDEWMYKSPPLAIKTLFLESLFYLAWSGALLV